jgi:hypothetical protein
MEMKKNGGGMRMHSSTNTACVLFLCLDINLYVMNYYPFQGFLRLALCSYIFPKNGVIFIK